MKKITLFVLILTSVFVAFSCKSAEPAAEPETVLISTFPTDWEENMFNQADQYGYFFTTPELGTFSMIEGEFKKLGGYEKSGFGFVFGYTADEEGWLSDYLRFEINTAGEYAVYAANGGTYIDLVAANEENTVYMNESDLINGGYDSANKLKIEKTGDKDYTLYINGTEIVSFTAPEGYGNSDGVMAFFSVGQENQEVFPDEPVKITYRITDYVQTVAEEK